MRSGRQRPCSIRYLLISPNRETLMFRRIPSPKPMKPRAFAVLSSASPGPLRRSAARIAAAGFVLIAAACLGPEEGEGQVQLPEYTLEPTVRIGSLDDPETALETITLLATTPDDGIAVAQPSSSSIWIFSSSGERRRVIGGEGDGPGEFRAVSAMGWRGDTLWASDGGNFRVTLFPPGDGSPTVVGAPDRRAEGVIRAPLPAGDGLWVLYRRWTLDPVLRTYREEIWSAGEDWAPLERLGSLPDGPDNFQIELPGTQGPTTHVDPIPEHPLFALAPDISSLTTVRREVERGGYAITRVGIDGDTVFHRDHSVEPVPVSDGTLTAILEEYLSQEGLQRLASSTRALRDAVISGLDLPEVHPAVTKVVVGTDGSSWLRGPDDRSGTVRWTVLDPNGEPSFTVQTGREIGAFRGMIETQNLVRMVADADGIWAVELGELDVPYLIRYELRR